MLKAERSEFMLNLLCLCVCYSVYMLPECACLLLGYYILYELCCICPCSHFQTSVSVFRLVRQTTVNPSSDKACLCVFVCTGHHVFVRGSPRVEVCAHVFLLWSIWGKPFVTNFQRLPFWSTLPALGCSAPGSHL